MNIDLYTVRDLFAGHYFLFAFLASLGTIQITTANSGIRGLWLTPHAGVTRLLGVALILTGAVIFFTQPLWVEGPWAAGSVEADSTTRQWGTAAWHELAGARNVNDIHGGLDGIKQAIWFSLATLTAFATSAIGGAISLKILAVSVDGASEEEYLSSYEDDGLEGLKRRSFLSNLPISYGNFRTDIPQVWNSIMEVADDWSVFKLFSERAGK